MSEPLLASDLRAGVGLKQGVMTAGFLTDDFSETVRKSLLVSGRISWLFLVVWLRPFLHQNKIKLIIIDRKIFDQIAPKTPAVTAGITLEKLTALLLPRSNSPRR